jgi:hypothetical protein
MVSMSALALTNKYSVHISLRVPTTPFTSYRRGRFSIYTLPVRPVLNAVKAIRAQQIMWGGTTQMNQLTKILEDTFARTLISSGMAIVLGTTSVLAGCEKKERTTAQQEMKALPRPASPKLKRSPRKATFPS